MTDADFMLAALKEAAKGEGRTRPNPPVGAVIVKDGEIIGRGYHHKCGCAHAEVDAITNARRRLGQKAADAALAGATIYVTLEPCSKPGRVGACTDAISAAGLARVVYAVPDPNPVNRGKAARALAKRGIVCVCLSKLKPTDPVAATVWARAVARARDPIAPFAKHITTGLPFVSVKIALSLDGRICDDFGDARWISSARSRKTTGAYRARVDAILVGGETVRRDNPSLLSHGKRNDNLIRAVVSRSGKLPKSAQIFTDGAPNTTLVYRDAREALTDLGRRGVLHVLCEGGLKLAVSLAREGLVDRWLTVLAPKVIGDRSIREAVAVSPAADAFVLFARDGAKE